MVNTEAGASLRTDYLDGWRGISILCVLQGHFFRLPFDLGGFGVCMFFSLSGMLMSDILFNQRQTLSKFYRRRISRVFPVFIVFVVVMFSLSEFWGTTFKWSEFWSTLFFARTYYPYPGIWGTGMPIGHLWSLNVEEHSYMFMSLLTLLPLIRKREALSLIACGSSCIFIGFIYVKLGQQAPFWGDLGSEVAASFLLISAGYRLIRDRISRFIPPWFPILALAAAVIVNQLGPWWLHRMVSPFLLALSVNHLSQTYNWFQTQISALPLRQAGLWSFSVYLWQQPFYASKASFPGGPVAALTCAIAVSLLSFYLIEKPCRTWLNSNWRSWRLYQPKECLERPSER